MPVTCERETVLCTTVLWHSTERHMWWDSAQEVGHLVMWGLIMLLVCFHTLKFFLKNTTMGVWQCVTGGNFYVQSSLSQVTSVPPSVMYWYLFLLSPGSHDPWFTVGPLESEKGHQREIAGSGISSYSFQLKMRQPLSLLSWLCRDH